MKKIKPWQILLIFSLIGVIILLYLIYSGFSGDSTRDYLYKKNIENRLSTVSNYINRHINSNGKLPSKILIKNYFSNKSLFKCTVTNEPLIFIPDIEKQRLDNKNKVLLIFNPKSYFVKKQKYGNFGSGRKVRNRHSFHTSLVLINGKVYWEILSSAEFFDILIPQLENDNISSDESNKAVIIKVIEFYLEYSKDQS